MKKPKVIRGKVKAKAKAKPLALEDKPLALEDKPLALEDKPELPVPPVPGPTGTHEHQAVPPSPGEEDGEPLASGDEGAQDFRDAEEDGDEMMRRNAEEIDRLFEEMEKEPVPQREEAPPPGAAPPVPQPFEAGPTGSAFRRRAAEMDRTELPPVRRPPAPTGEAFRRRAAEPDYEETTLAKRPRAVSSETPFLTPAASPRESFDMATPVQSPRGDPAAGSRDIPREQQDEHDAAIKALERGEHYDPDDFEGLYAEHALFSGIKQDDAFVSFLASRWHAAEPSMSEWHGLMDNVCSVGIVVHAFEAGSMVPSVPP